VSRRSGLPSPSCSPSPVPPARVFTQPFLAHYHTVPADRVYPAIWIAPGPTTVFVTRKTGDDFDPDRRRPAGPTVPRFVVPRTSAYYAFFRLLLPASWRGANRTLSDGPWRGRSPPGSHALLGAVGFRVYAAVRPCTSTGTGKPGGRTAVARGRGLRLKVTQLVLPCDAPHQRRLPDPRLHADAPLRERDRARRSGSSASAASCICSSAWSFRGTCLVRTGPGHITAAALLLGMAAGFGGSHEGMGSEPRVRVHRLLRLIDGPWLIRSSGEARGALPSSARALAFAPNPSAIPRRRRRL